MFHLVLEPSFKQRFMIMMLCQRELEYTRESVGQLQSIALSFSSNPIHRPSREANLRSCHPNGNRQKTINSLHSTINRFILIQSKRFKVTAEYIYRSFQTRNSCTLPRISRQDRLAFLRARLPAYKYATLDL